VIHRHDQNKDIPHERIQVPAFLPTHTCIQTPDLSDHYHDRNKDIPHERILFNDNVTIITY